MKKKTNKLFPNLGDIVVDASGREGLVIDESRSTDIHHITKFNILWLDSVKTSWTLCEGCLIYEIMEKKE